MKRAVISGATGTIGMALIQRLVQQKVEVLVLARKESERAMLISNNPLVSIAYCSINEYEWKQNDTGKKFDVFYHFAWDGTTGSSRDNLFLQTLNVKYTLDAVNLAERLGCHTFIGAGSQAEYGPFEGMLTPSTPAHPDNGYGIAKLCAGQMSRLLCSALEMKHIWVRILSIYGPYDGTETMVMSTIIKLLKGEVPKFTKGEQMWDYLYNEDAANAMYLLGDKGCDGKVYLLGSGEIRPLHEFIYEIRNLVNKDAEIEIGVLPYIENQVMFLCSDNSELIQDTGFTPETTFAKGIEKTIEWVKKEIK